jgi:large subunit ribosomal protein L28
MSRKCELTGKGPVTGNKVSHSNIKTRTRWLPNVKRKKFTIPELGETMTLTLSTHAIRTIDKLGGITQALFGVKEEMLSERLANAKRRIAKQRRAG